MTSPMRSVRLSWQGEGLRFRGAGTDPETPAIEIDADNVRAPGPMLQLLLAAAACSATDVVLILEKMRQELKGLHVDVTGRRAETDPKRFLTINLDFVIEGESIDPAKARRAVELSVDKYCSVIHSLASDIDVTYAVEIA